MAASDILKKQQAWLDLLQKSLADPSPAMLTALLATRAQQMADVQARIDDLGAQKQAAIQRFDSAIAEQQRALSALQTGTANTGPVLPPVSAAPSPAPAAPTRPNKAAARAAAKTRTVPPKTGDA